jgi:hypothetical protein
MQSAAESPAGECVTHIYSNGINRSFQMYLLRGDSQNMEIPLNI